MRIRSLVMLVAATAFAACGGGGSSSNTGPSTKPLVKSTVPPDGAAGVFVDVGMKIVFDQDMDVASVQLVATPPVQFNPQWIDKQNMECRPYALANETAYDVTITGKGTNGKDLDPTHVRFTTAAAAPRIVSIVPADGSTVGAKARVAITFSQPMDTASVVVIVDDGTVTYDLGHDTWSTGNDQVSFPAPGADLGFDKSYNITVNGKDVEGHAMAEAYRTFTVEPQPAVAQVSPKTGDTAGVGTTVGILFNVPVDLASVQQALSLVKSGAAMPVGWTCTLDPSAKQVTCTPGAALEYATTYTLSLASGAVSALFDSIAPGVLSTFSTVAVPDTIPPTVVRRDTAYDVAADNVLTTGPVVIEFSEPVNRGQAEANFRLTAGTYSQPNCGTYCSWDSTGTKMTFTPPSSALLPHGQSATWRIVGGYQDLAPAHNTQPADSSGTFKIVQLAAPQSLALSSAASGTVYQTGNIADITQLYAGDHATCIHPLPPALPFCLPEDNVYRSFFTFNLAALVPASTWKGVTAATLTFQKLSTVGTPFDGTLGSLDVDSLSYGSTLDAGDFDAPTDAYWRCFRYDFLKGKCMLSLWAYRYFPDTSQASMSLDVTSAARLALSDATRNKLAQFRIFFETLTNSDQSSDYVSLSPYGAVGAPSLTVSYEYSW
jgi:hypothetical protein